MKRILIFCEYPSLNGGERSLLAMLDHIRCDDLQIQFAGPDEGPLAEAIRQRGFRLDRLNLHDSAGHRHAIESCRGQVSEVIARCEPDLVHANSLSMSRLVAPVVSAQKIASVGHLRDMMKVNRTVLRDLAMNDRLLAVSNATRDWYVALGLPAEGIEVLYNGVDLEQFQSRSALCRLHSELDIPPASPIIGTIGQIGMRKGVDVVIKAAVRITTMRPDIHFALVGQRFSQKQEALDYEASLWRSAVESGISDRVHWLGLRDDVPRLMNDFSILLHLARQEPLGRVLLEAAASGLPCVASDVGGTREIFPHEAQAAILVPPEMHERAADAVLELLDNENLRTTMGKNARLRAEQQFDANAAAGGLKRHYRRLLSV